MTLSSEQIAFFEMVDRSRRENRARRPRLPITGYVYLVAARGAALPVKIGVSTVPDERLKALQLASPLPLHYRAVYRAEHIDIAAAIERRAHAQFSNWRCHGEWFNVDERAICAWLEATYAALLVKDPLEAVGNEAR